MLHFGLRAFRFVDPVYTSVSTWRNDLCLPSDDSAFFMFAFCGLVVQTTCGCFCTFGLVSQATSGYFWCLGLVRDFWCLGAYSNLLSQKWGAILSVSSAFPVYFYLVLQGILVSIPESLFRIRRFHQRKVLVLPLSFYRFWGLYLAQFVGLCFCFWHRRSLLVSAWSLCCAIYLLPASLGFLA